MSWARRFELRQWVRQSLWVVPLIGSLLGAALARVDLAVEDSVTLPLSWQYTPSTATALLAAVTGAMVGLLGLVVTIGVLVVQMATQTLSPRFMRLWYRDRLQKVTLAAFTFTFTFAYVLLRNVQNQAVPDLGITLAGLIVTIDLIVLLVFLNRFVHALRPVAVGAAMSRAGTRVIEGLRSSTAPRGVVPELSASGTPTAQKSQLNGIPQPPSTGISPNPRHQAAPESTRAQPRPA